VLRYAPAVRSYLGALIRNQHDADEVAQEFLLRMVEQPLRPAQVRRGRFRDYLKATLRNAAVDHFRRQPPSPVGARQLERLTAATGAADAEEEWRQQWRACLLERAWEGLQLRERESPGNLGYTILRLAVAHPQENSQLLADRLAARLGRPLSADAFRKQLSRARGHFARLLVDEVKQTLSRPSRELIVEELSDLGLLVYVRAFLPK
jgi:Sigma-70 region 2